MRFEMTIPALVAVFSAVYGCTAENRTVRETQSPAKTAVAERRPACGGQAPAALRAPAGPVIDAPGPADDERDKVLVEFFVMSKCPFGAQVEKLIAPVLAKFGERVEFRLEYIGTEKNGELTALHGPSEVRGDKIQLCAARAYPERYLELILCMNEKQREIPEGWRACAARLGLSTEPVLGCADGPEGEVLVRGSYMRSKERRALGSPTMFFNGQPYRGPRSELAFTRRICEAMGGDKPGPCADLPQPQAVEVTIIGDERCRDCRVEGIKKRLEYLLPGGRIQIVDYMSDAGHRLYAELGPGPVLLPVVIFGPEVEQADNWETLRRWIRPAGKHLVLGFGGRFDPTREICDNGVDDTGDGKVDCQDPDCVHAIMCRPEEQAKLEIFVMSQCPYAVRGLNALEQVLDKFKGDIRLEIHYIATAQGEGFRALHGQPEVDENIRQLCVMKHYPDGLKFMDYIWCRNKNIRSDEWRSCTGGNGIDAEVVSACADSDEGPELLRDDIAIAEGLKIRGSPTWLVNGRHKFNGIDARVIIDNFCRYNPRLAPCTGGN